LLLFDEQSDALTFLLGVGYVPENIGYSVFIGTEEVPDLVTFPFSGPRVLL
jgi:hypothetical protein